jgi:fucose permease
MFQLAFGLSPFRSGLYILALFAGDLSMKGFVVQVLRRFGFRNVMIVNGLLTAVSLALCATLTPSTPVVLLLAILFVHGALRSLEFTCMGTLAYADIPASRMSRANGFLSVVVQMAMGLGVPVGALILRLVGHTHGAAVASPSLHSFQLAILVASVLALGPVINSLVLSPDAGARTSGHKVPVPVEL